MTDHLQLSDLAFQRHILVQALILIDFLLALTEKAKSKPIYQKAQKAMQYSFTLREEDVSPVSLCLPRLYPLPCATKTMIITVSADHRSTDRMGVGHQDRHCKLPAGGPRWQILLSNGGHSPFPR
jgi:hypothetical protein